MKIGGTTTRIPPIIPETLRPRARVKFVGIIERILENMKIESLAMITRRIPYLLDRGTAIKVPKKMPIG
jgi:hypothetical protein